MRHNRCVPIQYWRAPAALRVKWAVSAMLCVAVAAVFFPSWFAIPAAVLIGGSSLGTAILGAKVTLDTEAGRLMVSLWPISRRVRLADVTAVMVEGTKVSIARARGGEISFYAWGRSRLDRRLGVRSAAGDIGHAISSASALAREQAAPDGPAASVAAADADPVRQARRRTFSRSRSALATALLAGVSILIGGSAFLVRLHWHNPVMTVLAVILALALGIGGLFYLLVSLLAAVLMLIDHRTASHPSGA